MSKLVLHFHFKLSKFNFYSGKGRKGANKPKTKESVILRVKENPEHDVEFYEDQEKDWLTLDYSENKVTVLDLVESEIEFKRKRKSPFLVG